MCSGTVPTYCSQYTQYPDDQVSEDDDGSVDCVPSCGCYLDTGSGQCVSSLVVNEGNPNGGQCCEDLYNDINCSSGGYWDEATPNCYNGGCTNWCQQQWEETGKCTNTTPIPYSGGQCSSETQTSS